MDSIRYPLRLLWVVPPLLGLNGMATNDTIGVSKSFYISKDDKIYPTSRTTILFISWSILTSFIIFFLLQGIVRGGDQGDPNGIARAMIWVLLWFGQILGLMGALAIADVIVDDVGVSRRIFGKICHQIKWNEIKCIREDSAMVSNKMVTKVTLYPKKISLFGVFD